MGSTKREAVNYALFNVSNYANKTQFKKLLKNYNNFYELTTCGDSVAASIYVDLKTALYHPKVLTELQRTFIIEYYLNNYTYADIGQMYGRSDVTILESINGGVKRMQKSLLEGTLYE